jgi:phage terminase large subunit-like protein
VSTPSIAELRQIEKDLTAALERKTYNKFEFFKPYVKQQEFLNAGKFKRERLLMAGNRLGKTEVGAYEATLHATGLYPNNWKGRTFEMPTLGWVAGETSLETRDVCQTKLIGPPGVDSLLGSGMIPRELIIDKPSLARGVTDAIDTVQVRHVPTGGVSIIRFKSYEQGRAKFQGEGCHWVWLDEEPPIDVYAEALARIGENDGIVFVTFTPINGPTAVVLRFTDEPTHDRSWIPMTIDDVPPPELGGHLTDAAKQRMIDGYFPHEREARARGVPALGSGRIFTTAEAAIIEPPLEYIPGHWHKLWGLDFGIGHPFAAVLMVWDKDQDIMHVHATVRMADALIISHAAAMKRIGAAVPVAWPRDGSERDRNTGEPLASQYRKHELRMAHEHATFEDGSVSTWAGIKEWDEREKTGRLRVAAHLTEWFEERRFYHMKDGAIVKIKDDLMSATRICLMAKRFARAVPLGGRWERAPASEIADGTDFDVFAVGGD